MTDLSNLTSGLIGALIGSIIGAVATYTAAIKGAEVSIGESIKADFERQEKEKINLKNQIITHLISEIEDNLKLSENVRISHAKIRFLNEAYEMAKLYANVLPKSLLKTLRPAYVEITRFNVLADYDQAKVDYGRGYLDDALLKQAGEVKNSLSGLEEKLQEYTKDNNSKKR